MKKTSTETLIAAMRILVEDIQSDDGVVNAAIAEAADRLEELKAEVDRLNADINAGWRAASGEHDAEVIESVASELAMKARDEYRRVEYQSGYLAAVNDAFTAANQLRQQAQS